MPESFTLLLALTPLIAYLLVLSLVRISGRALVTTGGRDMAALAIAIIGFLAVGPAELFFPTGAAIVFGPYVWIFLAVFYALCVSLLALTAKPKLVIYGRTQEEIFTPLLTAAQRLDASASGDAEKRQIRLPTLGVHLRIDGYRGLDYARVVPFEPNLSLRFWNQLLGILRGELANEPSPRPRRGFGMLLTALLMAGGLLWHSIGERAQIVEGFRDWLWR